MQTSLETFHINSDIGSFCEVGLRFAKTTTRNCGRAVHGCCLFRSTAPVSSYNQRRHNSHRRKSKAYGKRRENKKQILNYMKRAGLPACQAFVFSRWTDGALPSQLARFRPLLLYILFVRRKSLTSLWRNKDRGKDTVTVGGPWSVADFTGKTTKFWLYQLVDVRPYGLTECYKYFGGISWIYLQCRK